MPNKSVLDVEVSCFKNYWEEKNPRNVNLMAWLTSTKYKDKVDAIRAIDDKAKRDEIKATLPAITPSGLFLTRETKVPLQEKLISHSGLIQIDVDNLDEGDLEHIKKDLQTLDEIAYLGKSVSGRGLWGLIPIPPDPEYHRDYFDNLYKTFELLGITLDKKPKNVVSLRGYSYDPEGYFNHSAIPFLNKTRPIAKPNPKPVRTERSEATSSKGLEDWIVREMENLTVGDRHAGRLKLARQAGGFVAGGSMDSLILERLIESYLGQYGSFDTSHTQAKEIKAIRDGFENGKLFALYPKEPESQRTNQTTVYPVKVEIKNVLHEDYISQLYFENGMLMNEMDYPADWDLVGSYTEQKTKDFIRMSIRNPLLIELRKQFDLV